MVHRFRSKSELTLTATADNYTLWCRNVGGRKRRNKQKKESRRWFDPVYFQTRWYSWRCRNPSFNCCNSPKMVGKIKNCVWMGSEICYVDAHWWPKCKAFSLKISTVFPLFLLFCLWQVIQDSLYLREPWARGMCWDFYSGCCCACEGTSIVVEVNDIETTPFFIMASLKNQLGGGETKLPLAFIITV